MTRVLIGPWLISACLVALAIGIPLAIGIARLRCSPSLVPWTVGTLGIVVLAVPIAGWAFLSPY